MARQRGFTVSRRINWCLLTAPTTKHFPPDPSVNKVWLASIRYYCAGIQITWQTIFLATLSQEINKLQLSWTKTKVARTAPTWNKSENLPSLTLANAKCNQLVKTYLLTPVPLYGKKHFGYQMCHYLLHQIGHKTEAEPVNSKENRGAKDWEKMLLYHTIVHEEKMDHYPYGFKSVDSGENTGKKWFKCSRRSIQRHFENSWLTQGTTKRSSIGTTQANY